MILKKCFKLNQFEGEVFYACHVCVEGVFLTKREVKKHLQISHEEILPNISKESDDFLLTQHQNKQVTNKLNSYDGNSMAKEPHICTACLLLGGPQFISSNDKKNKQLQLSTYCNIKQGNECQRKKKERGTKP